MEDEGQRRGRRSCCACRQEQERKRGGWDGQTSQWGEHFHKEAEWGGAWLVLANFITGYIYPKTKGGKKFTPGEKLGGFALCWDQRVGSFLCLPPKHQAPVWFWRQVISFNIVQNLLLLFVFFANVHAISIMGKPRLANESWAAKAKLFYECKMEFYIIMHFIIIMMNCDCFPGKKWQYLQNCTCSKAVFSV